MRAVLAGLVLMCGATHLAAQGVKPTKSRERQARVEADAQRIRAEVAESERKILERTNFAVSGAGRAVARNWAMVAGSPDSVMGMRYGQSFAIFAIEQRRLQAYVGGAADSLLEDTGLLELPAWRGDSLHASLELRMGRDGNISLVSTSGPAYVRELLQTAQRLGCNPNGYHCFELLIDECRFVAFRNGESRLLVGPTRDCRSSLTRGSTPLALEDAIRRIRASVAGR